MWPLASWVIMLLSMPMRSHRPLHLSLIHICSVVARCDEREPQTLCVDGVVVVGLAIDAKRLGLSLIAAGHYATEFPVTAAVAEKLRTAFPELEVLVSEDARDPYTYL